MGDDGITQADRAWLRLKAHFRESFSVGLLARRRGLAEEGVDKAFERRRRNAFLYIYLLVALVLVPVVAYDFYASALVPALGALALLLILAVDIVWLFRGREAPFSQLVVMTLSIALLLFSLYYGQGQIFHLIFPLLLALPILLRLRFALLLALMAALFAAPWLLLQHGPLTTFMFMLSMGLTWLISAWLVFAVTEQSRRLRDMAVTDALTGAHNRRYLELQVTDSINDWQRYRRPVSLLLIDIDHFKRINDRFGHAAGDRALQALVRLVKNRIRKVDIFCRYGGEEFALLLTESTASQALRVAEELRAAAEESDILPEGRLTVSVGVCDVTCAESMEHWFKLADAALYLAKHSGRNRVELAAPEPEALAPVEKIVPAWR